MENTNDIVAFIQLLLTGIAAAIAILPPLLKMRSEKKKAEAEATGTLTESAMAMVQQWAATNERLEKRVSALEQENEYWKKGCHRLLRQLVANDIIPCWDPNGGPETQEGK